MLRRLAFVAVGLLVSSAGMWGQGRPGQIGAPTPPVPPQLRALIETQGRARVIVELAVPNAGPAEAELASAAVTARRRDIAAAQARVLARLAGRTHRVVHRYESVPYVALELGRNALDELERAGVDVARIFEDTLVRPLLSESVPIVQGDQAWLAGLDGSGATIAIIDSGVQANHPFLSGKVIEEACYSSTVAGMSQSLCPSGADVQVGPGAGAPCAGLAGCEHGTHVAGIAAGHGQPAGVVFSGVAKGAHLMAVQVFSRIIDSNTCGGAAPCLAAWDSDVIAGLERVYAVRNAHVFAAANLSLGGGRFTAPCDDQPYKPIIDNLRAAGIASVVASGNSAFQNALSAPACISSAVSVGSTSKSDVISFFSNQATFLSLVAPGEYIMSSVPGGGYDAFSGTSMATPHVAGAWAVIKQAAPTTSVDAALSALQSTGLPVTGFFGGSPEPRIRLYRALSALTAVTNPAPSATSLSPDRGIAGSSVTLTVNGSGFVDGCRVRWNGADRPTTVVSTTRLTAAISASDMAWPGTASVSVFTPAPGGGTSANLTFTIAPRPELTISSATVNPGAPATVTLTNGLGNSNDWLSFAATGASDTGFLQWTYVGAGVTTRTWTVTAPTTAGTYEFRFYPNGGYTRMATSPPITVPVVDNPVPSATSLSPDRAVAGTAAFTLTVTGNGFVNGSVVRWNGANRTTTFVSATQLRAQIAAADISTTGTAQVTVFSPTPGGGTSGSLTFTIAPPPVLTVSATTVNPGNPATVTLTNGLGNSNDWLSFAATGAADTSFLQYTYVGAGVTTRTWTVTAPTTAGTYEFRFYPNGGYTRMATSPAITVPVVDNPIPSATALSPNRAVAGSAAFTLTVTGSGFVNGSVVRWNGANRTTTFVSATELRAQIAAADISTTGTAQVTVFSPTPGGGTSGSLTFTIAPPPVLTVSATTVNPGNPATVTLTNGLGNSNDWLALAATGAADTSFLQWTYVGAGVTTRTWTVNMPTTAGTYEFRFYPNGGYTRMATSPTITVPAVAPPPPPSPAVLSVSTTSAAPGTPITVTLTNGAGNSNDWLAFAATGASNYSFLQWVYVGAGVTTRTWTVTAPATAGTYEFRYFLSGSYTLNARSPAITVSP